MIQIGDSPYYFDLSSREVYRKVKMTKQGYHIKDKHGKLKWISLSTIERCVVKMTNSSSSASSSSSQNDYPTSITNSQNDYNTQPTHSQNDYIDSQNDYGTFGDIEYR